MLELKIPAIELWDEQKEEFVYTSEVTLYLEHSLISIHKWESKWHKPFLSKKVKSIEEQIDYIRCMCLNKNKIDDLVFKYMPQNILDKVDAYISDSMTATTIYSLDASKEQSDEIATAEVIYSWMISLKIPVEFEKWHLNQLLTLIKVCSIRNAPKQNKSPQELATEFARLNEERQKQFRKG